MKAKFFIIGLAAVAAIYFTRSSQAWANKLDVPGILAAVTVQGLPYLTGGVGSDERAVMVRMGVGYSTKLVFAGRTGNYLAGVGVAVKDQSGKVVTDINGAGPWLYIKLPPGIYDVDATFEGKTVELDKFQVIQGRSVVRLIQWNSY